MANDNAAHRVRMDLPKHAPLNDTLLSDADTVDLMDGAEAVLAVTPNPRKAMDTKASPASLETQYGDDDDSREVSHLLDCLNDLGFDSPSSLLEAHSHCKGTPIVQRNSSAPLTVTHKIGTALKTPAAQRKVLVDKNNQTWPAGAKSIFRSSSKREAVEATTAKKRYAASSSPRVTSTRGSSHRPTLQKDPSMDYNDKNDDCNNNRSSEFEWDVSLEQLLEETAEAMLSPSSTKTFQFTEEEWLRLEKVQEMAEMLLHEAEFERDAARKWAKRVHESVTAWVEEQRALEKAHAEARATHDQMQLKTAREALNRMKVEMDQAATRHDMVEHKLEAIIQRQSHTISILQARQGDKAVDSAPALNTPRRPSTSIRATADSSTRLSRVSLSPLAVQTCDQVETDASAPFSAAIDPITPTKHDALFNSVPSPVSMTITPRTQRARTTLMDGGKLVVYRNGTEKETRPDGTVVIRFPNGDVKCTLGSDKTADIVAYYHAKENVSACFSGCTSCIGMNCFLPLFLSRSYWVIDDSYSPQEWSRDF